MIYKSEQNRRHLEETWMKQRLQLRARRVRGYLSELTDTRNKTARPSRCFLACAMLDPLRGYEPIAGYGQAQALRTPMQGYGRLRGRIERALSDCIRERSLILPLETGCEVLFYDFLESTGLVAAFSLAVPPTAVCTAMRAIGASHEGVLITESEDQPVGEEAFFQVARLFDLFETACDPQQTATMRLASLAALLGIDCIHRADRGHPLFLPRVEDLQRVAFLLCLLMEQVNMPSPCEGYALDEPFSYRIDRERFAFLSFPMFDPIITDLIRRNLPPSELLHLPSIQPEPSRF